MMTRQARIASVDFWDMYSQRDETELLHSKTDMLECGTTICTWLTGKLDEEDRRPCKCVPPWSCWGKMVFVPQSCIHVITNSYNEHNIVIRRRKRIAVTVLPPNPIVTAFGHEIAWCRFKNYTALIQRSAWNHLQLFLLFKTRTCWSPQWMKFKYWARLSHEDKWRQGSEKQSGTILLNKHS